MWRNHKHLYNISLIQNFKETYQIEWGKHKWLNYIENDNAWSDKIVINTTHYRFPTDLNFESIKTNKNIIYVIANKTTRQNENVVSFNMFEFNFQQFLKMLSLLQLRCSLIQNIKIVN